MVDINDSVMESPPSLFGTGIVQDSEELQRIIDIPRRSYDDATIAQHVIDYTALLKTPHGKMTLRPIQAVALNDIRMTRGLLAPIGVGHGKTLISLLAPRIVGARRPLLVIPASLKEKTFDDIEELRHHWFLPSFVRVETYEFLSRVNAASLLTRYQPDIIVCDEAHRLKNSQAACTKRIRRYLQENAEIYEKTGGTTALCRFVALSGTLTKRSLKDYAHLSAWALRDLSPVPRVFPVLMEWCGALDEDGGIRTFAPGALARLAQPGEEPVTDQNSARRAFQRRLRETPGVVATQEGSLDVSLEIDHDVIPDPPADLYNAMKDLRDYWRLPDGHDFIEGVECWRHAREMCLGFYYRWDPWPPEEWALPRAEWSKALRNILKNNRRHLDTDLQVRQALEAHPDWYPDEYELWQAWEQVRDTFVPNTVPVWISDHAIERAAAWAQDKKGIVWIEHQAFGERFTKLTGIPFYGEGGLDARGARIEHHNPSAPLAASILSNCTGRNLQAWGENYVVSPPPSGNTVEQMLGRTHRPGQGADTVYATWLFAGVEHVNAFERCLGDAEYVQNSQGTAQKILYADRTFDPEDILIGKSGPMWVKSSKPL